MLTAHGWVGGSGGRLRRYVRDTLAFSIQRCGFLYGECDDEGSVRVQFIYEPPQVRGPRTIGSLASDT